MVKLKEGKTMLCWVKWHGKEWERAVENGWVTMYVVRIRGVRIARMILEY